MHVCAGSFRIGYSVSKLSSDRIHLLVIVSEMEQLVVRASERGPDERTIRVKLLL